MSSSTSSTFQFEPGLLPPTSSDLSASARSSATQPSSTTTQTRTPRSKRRYPRRYRPRPSELCSRLSECITPPLPSPSSPPPPPSPDPASELDRSTVTHSTPAGSPAPQSSGTEYTTLSTGARRPSSGGLTPGLAVASSAKPPEQADRTPMKVQVIRLSRDPNKSPIVYREVDGIRQPGRSHLSASPATTASSKIDRANAVHSPSPSVSSDELRIIFTKPGVVTISQTRRSSQSSTARPKSPALVPRLAKVVPLPRREARHPVPAAKEPGLPNGDKKPLKDTAATLPQARARPSSHQPLQCRPMRGGVAIVPQKAPKDGFIQRLFHWAS